jgi:hypothetical protein
MPVSRLTRIATQITNKLPSWCSATGPLSKFVSHSAPCTEEPSVIHRVFTGLCDDLKTVVDTCVDKRKNQKQCVGMSGYMHNMLVPVHLKRGGLHRVDEDLDTETKTKLADFDSLYRKVLPEVFSIVVGPLENDDDENLLARVCDSRAEQWGAVGADRESFQYFNDSIADASLRSLL